MKIRVLMMVTGLMLFLSLGAVAENASPPSKGDKGEKIDVEKLRNKYWSQGEQGDVSVVQNRQFTKAGRLEFSTYFGLISSDPFLSVKSLGAGLDYYFSETWALQLSGWKNFSSNSSTYDDLQAQGLNVQTNKPEWFAGAGLNFIPIYGKLSLLDNHIFHFDLGLGLGAGITSTESGKYFTPYAALSQRLYLSKHFSLKFEYRLMRYDEQLPANVRLGAPASTVDRTNWTNSVQLGFGFLF